MQKKRNWFILFAGALSLVSCFYVSENKTNEEGKTVFVNTPFSAVNNNEKSIVPDSLMNGPFVNRINYVKNDQNGGFEQYELNMNLFEPTIQQTDGSFCYGTLILFVKSPDSSEAFEVSRRIISRVYAVEKNEARLLMTGGSDRPHSFEATLTYLSEEDRYQLLMKSDPLILDDMIENQLIFGEQPIP